MSTPPGPVSRLVNLPFSTAKLAIMLRTLVLPAPKSGRLRLLLGAPTHAIQFIAHPEAMPTPPGSVSRLVSLPLTPARITTMLLTPVLPAPSTVLALASGAPTHAIQSIAHLGAIPMPPGPVSRLVNLPLTPATLVIMLRALVLPAPKSGRLRLRIGAKTHAIPFIAHPEAMSTPPGPVSRLVSLPLTPATVAPVITLVTPVLPAPSMARALVFGTSTHAIQFIAHPGATPVPLGHLFSPPIQPTTNAKLDITMLTPVLPAALFRGLAFGAPIRVNLFIAHPKNPLVPTGHRP